MVDHKFRSVVEGRRRVLLEYHRSVEERHGVSASSADVLDHVLEGHSRHQERLESCVTGSKHSEQQLSSS